MRLLLLVLTGMVGWAHAPITPALEGPLRTEGARIVDAGGAVALLRGAKLPGVDAATVATLGVMRLRWNFNTVRIPVSTAEWQRGGDAYLDRVAGAVARARDAKLVVVLAADVSSDPFWTAFAGRFREASHVLFSLGAGGGQGAFDAIRTAGARQVVAVPAAATVRGENILYEATVAVGGTNPLSALAGRVPVYAGEWGLSSCTGLSADPKAVSDAVFQTLFDFDTAGVHWTASEFAVDSLLRDTVDYEPSVLATGWRCGQPGMGQTVLTWMTGDPIGFGYLRKEAVASAAGGPASPAAPGQLLSLYIEQMGPSPDQFGRLDLSGRLTTELGGTEVLFDGERVPVLFAGQYQINVQAPYSLTPGKQTVVQVVYRGVPSNRLALEVVPAAAELFHDVFTKNVIALNENGTRNGEANPAAGGAIVVLFGTGTGRPQGGGTAGVPAPAPHPVVDLPVSLRVDGQEAEILFAGEVPGFVGLSQINARLPRLTRVGAAPVVLRVGGRDSQAAVVLSVR